MNLQAEKVATLNPDQRRSRLLHLLKCAQKRGARFVPVSQIDDFVSKRQPAIFLKHDIHHVSPRKLISLAENEIELGICGTYFFMSLGHPLGAKFFSAEDQKIMMSEIAAMGHEIGAHVDALYETRSLGKSLRVAVAEQLDSFGATIGKVSVANLHGNTALKITDAYGNNLIYDLFEELERQPDYPELRHVSSEVATYIKNNRISLRSLDLSHWGDGWIWSREKGLIASNNLSDNWMGKNEVLKVAVRSERPCAYGLDARPNLLPYRKEIQATWVSIAAPLPDAYRRGGTGLGIRERATKRFFREALPRLPMVMLLHPQFYAV